MLKSCSRSFALPSFMLYLLGGAHLSAAPKPDRMKPLERVEASKIANGVAHRILLFEKNQQAYHFDKTPSTKRDYSLACSIAHGLDLGKAEQKNEHLLRLTSENAEEDPGVLGLATEMQKRRQYDAFSVSAWPVRDLPKRGTWVILIRMHHSNTKGDESFDINPVCY